MLELKIFSENLRFFFGKTKISCGICKKCGLIIQNNTVEPKAPKKLLRSFNGGF